MKETDSVGPERTPGGKFKRHQITPQAVTWSEEEVVKVGFLKPDQVLPLLVEPQVRGSKLHAWAQANRAFVETNLLHYGGILFRGFAVRLDEFAQFLRAVFSELLAYMESATPRTDLGDKIYTSTEFPPSHAIALHNELTYVTNWPLKICFFCQQPAERGGETPIADVRRVYQRLEPAVRHRFREKGWMLVRNFNDGLGLPWQTAYHTTDRAEVEQYFSQNQIEFEWKDRERLRTRQVRPAVARHPKTGELVWFNHIAFWHVSGLSPALREAMQTVLPEADLPYNTYYGDGSPIEPAVIALIRQAYAQETVTFQWQAGDVLVLDNMLVAHGRNPYAGERRVLVAMAEPARGHTGAAQ